MQEIEYKFKVDDHNEIKAAMSRHVAVATLPVEQTDIFFDWPDGRIRSADSCLRLRTLKQIGQSDKFEITYKGPRQDAAAKVRSEYQTALAKPAAMEEILLSLGMVKTLTLQKRRMTYFLDSCKVELDELPYIGRFVEIEGPSMQQIEAVKQLIAPEAEHIDESYATMICKYCRENNIDSAEIVFQDF